MRSVRFLLIFVGLIGWAVYPLRATGEQSPDDLLAEARDLLVQEGPENALSRFEAALAAYRGMNDREGEAIALGLLGYCRMGLGEYDSARELLDRALDLKRQLGIRLEEGKTLGHLGLLSWETGELDEAIGYFEAGLAIAREVDDAQLEGASLNNLGLVHDERGEYEKSLERYEAALETYENIDFPRGQSAILGNIGGVHLLLGEFRQALPYYEESLAIGRREALMVSMGQDLGNMALCYLGLGEMDRALESFDQALELARATGVKIDEAYWLKGRGQALLAIGEYGRGLEDLKTAVDLYNQIGARTEAIEALHELGMAYMTLGDAVSAERQFHQAIELAQEIGLARGVTYNLLALGDLEWRRQRFEEAEALYLKALLRAQSAREVNLESDSELRLAFTFRDLGQLEVAKLHGERALALAQQIGARSTATRSLLALGDIDRIAGQTVSALSVFRKALKEADLLADPDLRWRSHYGIARSLEAGGEFNEAIGELERAVSIVEDVRSRLRQERFRAGYIEDKYQIYVDLVRLLLKVDRVEDAFRSAERLRARRQLELRHKRPLSQMSSESRRREFELRQRVRRLQEALEEEVARPQDQRRQAAVSTYQQELSVAEREYQAFLDDQRSSTVDSPTTGLFDPPELATIQRALPNNLALIEYVVANDELIAFAMTREELHAKTVLISRRQLEARIELLRDLLTRPGEDLWQKPAKSLAAALVDPLIEAGWLDAIDRLVIVPHGVLHYLPFAVLPGSQGRPGRLLVEDLVVTFLPSSAALIEDHRSQTATGSLLGLAPTRTQLRFARDEVRSIARLVEPSPELLLGEEATEAAFKMLAPRFRYVHLATHGRFNRLNPLLSSLMLEADSSNDGLLEVHEILDLRLAAELVVLSACETALARGHFAEIPAGDDFVGLTRAFSAAGSSAVLATLWEVDDRSTGKLMERLYGHLGDSRSPSDIASALAAAQRKMLEAGGPESHPYYWAPFVLSGSGAVQTGPEPEKLDSSP